MVERARDHLLACATSLLKTLGVISKDDAAAPRDDALDVAEDLPGLREIGPEATIDALMSVVRYFKMSKARARASSITRSTIGGLKRLAPIEPRLKTASPRSIPMNGVCEWPHARTPTPPLVIEQDAIDWLADAVGRVLV
jgi:hypothetical protein